MATTSRVVRLAAILAVLAAGTGGAWLAASPAVRAKLLERAGVPVPIPAAEVREPREVNWARVARRGKYATFDKLADTLRKGNTPESASAAFEALGFEGEALEHVRLWGAQLEGDQRERALQELWDALMRAPSDVDVLFGSAQSEIDSAFMNAATDSTNHGRYFAWGMSRPVMACLMAYKVTGQVRFLDLLADTFDEMLKYRDCDLGRVDEVRGRVMRNWGTNRYSTDGRYSAEITTAGRVTWPMALFVQIVRADDALAQRFGERADRYMAVTREVLAEYDDEFLTVPGTDRGYYLHVPRQLAEPLNHMAWTACCLLTLWELTGESEYRRKAEYIARYFRWAMWEDANGCLVWNYQPQPHDREDPAIEFVWKARTTLDVPLYFASKGVVFTDEDLRKICKTFLTNVHRGDRWNAHLHQEFLDIEKYNSGGGLLSLTPYVQLEPWEPRVRTLVEDAIATRRDLGGWLHRGHGIVGYAWRLRDQKGDGPEM